MVVRFLTLGSFVVLAACNGGDPNNPGGEGDDSGTVPPPTGGPTDGQVVLASEKYLNKNAGPPNFRKGQTVVRKGGV